MNTLKATIVLVIGTLVIAACDDGGSVAAVDRLECDSVAAFDSYHIDSRTALTVSETGAQATPNPNDLAPFSVSWDVEADFTDGGESAQGNLITNDSGSEGHSQFIHIGDSSWVAFGGGDYIARETLVGPIPFPPSDTCNALAPDLELASMGGTPEDVNGIKSVRYEISDLPATALADMPSLGSSGDAVTVVDKYDGTIWVASDGYISKLELAGDGEYEGGRRAMNVELAYEYSDINDVDAEIVAPQPRAGQ